MIVIKLSAIISITAFEMPVKSVISKRKQTVEHKTKKRSAIKTNKRKRQSKSLISRKKSSRRTIKRKVDGGGGRY